MATNNQVNAKLSGATGTGNFAGAESPVFTTPVLGAATATSLNYGASTTNGTKGVTTNNDAASGYVGEYLSSSVLVGSKVGLVDNVFKTLVSLALTAGDWDVCGTGCLEYAGTTTTVRNMYLSLTDNGAGTAPGTNNNFVQSTEALTTVTDTVANNVGVARFSLASPTTIYLTANVNFSAGTVHGYGFIGARRVR